MFAPPPSNLPREHDPLRTFQQLLKEGNNPYVLVIWAMIYFSWHTYYGMALLGVDFFKYVTCFGLVWDLFPEQEHDSDHFYLEYTFKVLESVWNCYLDVFY